MKYIVFILFTLSSSKASSCICPSKAIKATHESSVMNSDIIFLGEVVETDTIQHLYKIRALEFFKGKPSEMLIGSSMVDSTHYSSCAFWPFAHLGTEFIFYATYARGTDEIFIDQCSATRSISNPQIHLSYFTGKYEKMQGILYKEMTFDEKIRFLKTYNKLKQIAFKDFIKELRILRKLRKG